MITRTPDIPLSSLLLTEAARGYAKEAIDSGWVSGTGVYIGRFEEALRKRVDRQHCIAVANGTVALEVALRALGIERGENVYIPALTFAAPAAAVRSIGACPVFVDIHPVSWTIDPAKLGHGRSHADAMIAVDLLGHPADYDQLSIAVGHTFLIEDAAEAHGALYKGKPVGSFGRVSTFSFMANKTIATGEGGAILTNGQRLADALRLRVNHGMTKERPYFHEVVGTNARMTNITAAIGLGQVEAWDTLVGARQQVAKWYDKHLPEGVSRRPVASWATESVWLYTVTHPERDRVVAYLRERGIDARAIWPALPDLPLYNDGGDYPVARKVSAEAFWLPTSALMNEEQVAYICGVLREAV